jgi:hypothetical protein
MFSSSVKQQRQSAQSLRRIQPRLPETSSRSSTGTTRRSSTVSPRRIKELHLLNCRSRRSNAVAGARRNQALFFLQAYADALICLDADAMAGVVSPPLMGSHGTVPLTVIGPHHRDRESDWRYLEKVVGLALSEMLQPEGMG